MTSAEERGSNAEERRTHIPVLLEEVLQGLDLTPGQTVFEGTGGSGGTAGKDLNNTGTINATLPHIIDHDITELINYQRSISLLESALKVTDEHIYIGRNLVKDQDGFYMFSEFLYSIHVLPP